MKTIELTGKIDIFCDNWYKIKLVQEDGYKIDLVSRFQEIKDSYPKSSFQVNYYLSNNPCTKNEMIENLLKRLHGDITANYEQNDYCYSSWTSGTDYDTVLQIGGHNLYKELCNKQDKFIILEINIK